ncbi:hypothetical protein PMG11_07018 [Penicillium brasilianum]|uniref:Major facilitator superfamily (MFS) profile domain-containing protein n=1 Tax=Penicillium brasilianum TaxID=104259 RepID=A0A0F7TNP0_PENBI|nr:hypothetical protein PMG11_07018 [Penicillium brasilianum]
MSTEPPSDSWVRRLRSSPAFLVIVVTMALFTDSFLYSFPVPILPYILSERVKLDPSMYQLVTSYILAQSAVVHFIFSPVIGYLVDRTPSHRRAMLVSLTLSLVASIGLALAKSLPVLFATRFLQSLATTTVFVTGFSTLASAISDQYANQVNGLVSATLTAGTSGGCMAAGVLLEIATYWGAWSAAFGLLLVDIILRLLMLEKSKCIADKPSTDDANAELERDRLLPTSERTETDICDTPHMPQQEVSALHFYCLLFRDRSFLAGTACFVALAMIISTFDTTLPLLVYHRFHWGSLRTGMLFFGLQAPTLILTPVCGWLKDRIGSRLPCGLGLLGTAIFAIVTGLAGDSRVPWFSEGPQGAVLFTIGIVGIGCLTCLIQGVGTAEAMGAIHRIELESPGIFGPNGGYARAAALSGMCFTVGLLIGPLLSGTLIEGFGWLEMNSVLGIICVLTAANACLNLRN